jgi:RNase P subunit RPR2
MMTNEHLIKMRLGASTEEVDETVTYLRAYCKSCGSEIGIELHTIDDRSVRLEAFVAKLRVWCDRCGQTRDVTIRAKFTSTAQHLGSLTNLQH